MARALAALVEEAVVSAPAWRPDDEVAAQGVAPAPRERAEVDGVGGDAGASGYDVVVVGAGPAGACAAIAAADAGARTLLVERARFPRTKVCGSCLTAAGVRALAAIGADSALEGARPLRRARVACGARELAFARDAGVAIGRDELDARLVAIARTRGVAFVGETRARVVPAGREGAAVDRRAPVDPRGRLVELVPARGPSRRVRARVVVVADGLGGTALDEAGATEGLEWRVARRSHIGFGGMVDGRAVACDEGEVRLFVGAEGYLGAVGLPTGAIDLAAAVRPAALRAAGGVGPLAARLLGNALRDRGALDAARWKGTPELTRRRARVAGDGILVVGDAAGYVEPFTGEGMTWAIRSGLAAGALAARDPDAARAWPARHARLVGGARLRCRAIALLLRLPALVEPLLALGARAPAPFERLAVAIGSGGRSGGAR